MQRWYRRQVTVAVVALLAIAASAHATINMTGRWIVVGADESPQNYVQVGTALTETSASATRTGSIDSATGAFSVADSIPCLPLFGPDGCSISGTVAPDGLTFTGTFACVAASPHACMVVLENPVTGWFSPPTCGNGTLDPGEQCDDGNNALGDCCDPGCRFIASGARCNADPNFCNDPRTCDGAGACLPIPCKAPTVAGAGRLGVSGSGGTTHWKWTKGQGTTLADFGDPVQTDAYTLCLIDESGPTPNANLPEVIESGTGWRSRGPRGFTYRSPAGGVRATLVPGVDGKARITLTTPDGPVLPLPLPFTVQLYGHGGCWGATYDAGGVRKNTPTHFVGTSAP